MYCATYSHGAAPLSRPVIINSMVLTQRGLACFMAALRAAETANSPYYRMSSALPALAYAAEPVVAVSTRDLAALIAVAEEAPAAIKQLRGVLPHSWVASLQVDADAGLAMLPAAKLRLQGISAPDDDERMAAAEQAAAAEKAAPTEGCTCSGCGQRAIGLRRCARCKQAACEWGGEAGCVGLTRFSLLNSSSTQLWSATGNE